MGSSGQQPTTYGVRSTAADCVRAAPSLRGVVAIVTGGNGGIGFEACKELLRGGASVVMGCRSPARGADAVARLLEELGEGVAGPRRLKALTLDVSSFASIRAFVAAFEALPGEGPGPTEDGWPLHILLNNAGIMSPASFSETADGHELQWGTNFLGPFLLTSLLLPRLRASAVGAAAHFGAVGNTPRGELPSRVVNVTSMAHATGKIDLAVLRLPAQGGAKHYGGFVNYSNSKLALLMHATELNRREAAAARETSIAGGEGRQLVEAFSVHPGVIATGLGADASCCSFTRLLYACPRLPCTPSFISIPQGAATGVRCCVDPAASAFAGRYFANCVPAQPHARDARDATKQQQLFEQSLEWCGLAAAGE